MVLRTLGGCPGNQESLEQIWLGGETQKNVQIQPCDASKYIEYTLYSWYLQSVVVAREHDINCCTPG